MAGTATPNGLTPIGLLGGTPFAGAIRQIPITTTYAASIFCGDVVELSADGTVISQTEASVAVNIGVFMGCKFTDSVVGPQWREWWPASQVATDAVAYVCMDPNATYRIQADEAVSQANLGANFSLVLTAGSTINGRSRQALDGGSGATTNTLPVRLVDFWHGPGSAVGDTYTDCVVMLNPHLHQYADSLGT
jgi:hypothetical protein